MDTATPTQPTVGFFALSELQEDSSATAIVRILGHLKPLGEVGFTKRGWVSAFNELATFLMATAGVFFLMLCAFALAHARSPLPKGIVISAVIVGLASQSAALLALALQTVAGVASIWMSRRHDGFERVLRCEHDQRNASRLVLVSKQALDTADKWLEQEAKRIESRLAIFFGGSDKLALFAVVGTAWAVWKEFPNGILFAAGSPVLLGLALLGGFAFAGLMMRRTLGVLAYSRDLIALARAATKPAVQ